MQALRDNALEPEIPDGPRQRYAPALVEQEALPDRQLAEMISIGTLPPALVYLQV
jgi:hypothetical protein